MIKKIDNENIVVEEYGLAPGSYHLNSLSAETLARERNILHIKLLYDRGEINVKEMVKVENLIERLSSIITKKCEGEEYGTER